MIDLSTVAEGEVHQIDYDKQQRITVIHVQQRDETGFQIRFAYPAGQMRDLFSGQEQYAILWQAERPEVSVVRLA